MINTTLSVCFLRSFVRSVFFFFFLFSGEEEDVSYGRHLAQKRLWPCLEGGPIFVGKKRSNFITFLFFFEEKVEEEEELVRAAMFIQTFARCSLYYERLFFFYTLNWAPPHRWSPLEIVPIV